MNQLSIEQRSRPHEWATVAAGLALLLVRPYLAGATSTRTLAMGVIFSAVLLASVAGPRPRQIRQVHPAVVLAVGAAAMAIAGTVSGPSLPSAGLAATPLLMNTLAAVSEEAFFRRFLYARFMRWGAAVAVTVTALLFAAVHVPIYGLAAFPVDLGAGLLFGWQRWASGSWSVPAATHAWANLLVMAR